MSSHSNVYGSVYLDVAINFSYKLPMMSSYFVQSVQIAVCEVYAS